MENKLHPGRKGEPLPDNVIVVRLAKPTSDGSGHAAAFDLSTEDKESELQSLSVWARDLTPPLQARELMGDNKSAYKIALHLNVDQIRGLEPPLDVVWDPDQRQYAEGHAGIVGLKKPPGASKAQYKMLRVFLADIAVVEILPD